MASDAGQKIHDLWPFNSVTVLSLIMHWKTTLIYYVSLLYNFLAISICCLAVENSVFIASAPFSPVSAKNLLLASELLNSFLNQREKGKERCHAHRHIHTHRHTG